MMSLVTDGGVQFVDDDYKPITIDEALITVRRVAAWVESIGSEPKRDDNEPLVAVASEIQGGCDESH